MVAQFLRLKLRLLANIFRRSPWQVVGIVIGLVYGVEAPDADGGVTVRLTMTSAACPMADLIIDQVHDALAGAFGADALLTVDLVWDPPWTPDRMSDLAREQFGWAPR